MQYILLLLWVLIGCQSTLPARTYENDLKQYILKPMESIGTARTYALQRDSLLNILQSSQPVEDLYSQDETYDIVIDFFTDITGSEEIAILVCSYAYRYRVPILTAFSLAAIESQYNIHATNKNATSTDRGLFQLNSRTFRHMRPEDFFDLETNIHHGIAYLRECMNKTDDIAVALAIYNAGAYRVLNGLTPQTTERHVTRIQKFEEELFASFSSFVLDHIDIQS